MFYRRIVTYAAVVFATAFARPAVAQDSQAKRLASMVSVAVDEYGKAVDERGALVSKDEFAEASDFLRDAQGITRKLSDANAAVLQAAVDSMATMVAQKQPPSKLMALHARFVTALGDAGKIDLPIAPVDPVRGQALYAVACASCHGAMGLGDGAQAHAISPPVPAIGDARKTPELTPIKAYNVMSVGVTGTAMPSFASTFTSQQRWNIINYVYTGLRQQPMTLPSAAASGGSSAVSGAKPTPQQAAVTVRAILDSALMALRSGDVSAAGDRAFDAYLAFEPLETTARAKDPKLVTGMERAFADFKGALRRGDSTSAIAARTTIVETMPRIVALNQSLDEGKGEAFWQSFLIILREGFEAILVIGAVVAFLIKTGNRNRLRSIWAGVGLAVVASVLTAIVIKTVFASIPASKEIVEASSLLIAVVVLFSVSYWLISKVEAAKWQQFIRERVSSALNEGGGRALALVAFLAVYREGAETALFYQALFQQGSPASALIGGILAGGAVLAVIFFLFYKFGVKIPMRPFFTITSVLLYYMAFVFAGKGVRELQEGNVISMTQVPHFPTWDTFGIFPTIETLAIQGVLLVAFVFMLIRTFAGKKTVPATT